MAIVPVLTSDQDISQRSLGNCSEVRWSLFVPTFSFTSPKSLERVCSAPTKPFCTCSHALQLMTDCLSHPPPHTHTSISLIWHLRRVMSLLGCLQDHSRQQNFSEFSAPEEFLKAIHMIQPYFIPPSPPTTVSVFCPSGRSRLKALASRQVFVTQLILSKWTHVSNLETTCFVNCHNRDQFVAGKENFLSFQRNKNLSWSWLVNLVNCSPSLNSETASSTTRNWRAIKKNESQSCKNIHNVTRSTFVNQIKFFDTCIFCGNNVKRVCCFSLSFFLDDFRENTPKIKQKCQKKTGKSQWKSCVKCAGQQLGCSGREWHSFSHMIRRKQTFIFNIATISLSKEEIRRWWRSK